MESVSDPLKLPLAARAQAALERYVDVSLFGHGTCEADGLRIHFQHGRSNTGTRPVVVLVHGLGLSGRYMLPTAQALLPHYDVFLPDLPGFGDSDKPSRLQDIEALAASLVSWMTAMQFPRAVALLGNSLGCQVIAAALDLSPSCARAAILQGPTTPPSERHVIHQLLRWRQNLRLDPPEMKIISRGDYVKCGRFRVWGTFYLALGDAMEERLSRISQPALVVRGEMDPICRKDWAIDIAARLPAGRLVELPGVAHTLVFTAPVPLARVTRGFLDTVMPAGA
ncbi:MAG: alpha/beta fold hydrolase [Rhodospirillaceae bacterium]